MSSGPVVFQTFFSHGIPSLLLLFSRGILLGIQNVEQIKIETSLIDIREAGWSLKSCYFNVPCSTDYQSFSMERMGALEPSLRTTDHPMPSTHRREEEIGAQSGQDGAHPRLHCELGWSGLTPHSPDIQPGSYAVPGAGFPAVHWHSPRSSCTHGHTHVLSGALWNSQKWPGSIYY